MRTDYCGLISERHLDQTVELNGWVHRRRDHGGVIFIDLRDREGVVQVVIDPDTPEAFATADKVRNEFVLRISGRVRRRPEGTTMAQAVDFVLSRIHAADLKTGSVEYLGQIQ